MLGDMTTGQIHFPGRVFLHEVLEPKKREIDPTRFVHSAASFKGFGDLSWGIAARN
jgi:hypothetical protein